MTKPTPALLEVYAPLSDFPWRGTNYSGFPGLEISNSRPDLHGLDDSLARDEVKVVKAASHWLIFEWLYGSKPSASETINLLLLALWLTHPTKTQVCFSFRSNVQHPGTGAFRRLLDRFNWNRLSVRDILTTANLNRAAYYYKQMRPVVERRGRLFHSLMLSMAGCMECQWHAALLCQAAAVETLLSYSKRPGITDRLAKSFACMVHRSNGKRDSAFKSFRALYGVRSDVVHGRLFQVPHRDKLRSLARMELAAKRIWRPILKSPNLQRALEGSDSVREGYFKSREAGYVPPP